jgi:hypothetical protein
MLEKVCRNCGSTDVAILDGGCDLDPFVAYRVYGLRTKGQATSTRLRTGKKLKLIDRLLGGALSHLARFCTESEVSSWTIIDAMICNSCEFYTVYHPFTDSLLARMYHDYRSEAYQKDWERFHPGYIETTGRYIGGPEESATRLVSMNAYLSRMEEAGIINTAAMDSALDWGGSDGIMLPKIFQQLKRYVHDISDRSPVDGVRKLKTIDPKQTFSYIQITHVLEHVFEPLRFLAAPRHHLEPGGILYLEVPLECEANGLSATVLHGQRRLRAHEHINLFTPRSLRALVERSGFRVLDLTVETIDFFWCKGPCLRLLATPAEPA